MSDNRLNPDFFQQDVLTVAPNLLGKKLIVKKNQHLFKYSISEVEAYRGEEDKACHASKGKTQRTKVMYEQGGILYVYLIYGMYWMLNIVTGPKDNPQAVLIRGVKDISGPGRVTRSLGIDKSFNGENIFSSERIWILDTMEKPAFETSPRIGIDYAGDYWKNKPWRFYIPLDKSAD